MKLVETVKRWSWQILAIMFFLLFLGKGCTSTKISKTNKNIDEMHSEIDSLNTEISKIRNQSITRKDLKDEMERVMLDFLIYEDDLDRGKTSLSQIKNKIEEND
jgi:septal ring factor EnvC (AmiA/AmiB activator)